AGAKAELDRLQKTHPLTQPLRAALAKAGTPVDVSSLPEVGTDIPADWHEAVKRALGAKSKGDMKRAEQLLEAAVIKSQDEPEALSALADLKWETGDKAGALPLYKKIVDKGKKAGPFFKHARERTEADGSGDKPAPAAAPGRGRTHDDGRVPDDYVAPGSAVDTSDMPG